MPRDSGGFSPMFKNLYPITCMSTIDMAPSGQVPILIWISHISIFLAEHGRISKYGENIDSFIFVNSVLGENGLNIIQKQIKDIHTDAPQTHAPLTHVQTFTRISILSIFQII